MSPAKIRFDILTIFPEAFASAFSVSILKRAQEAGEIEFVLHDIRQYAEGAHREVDDAPYGGGAGMVMKAAPIINAFRGVEKIGENALGIFLTPQGSRFSQETAKDLSSYRQLIFVCGHYEGIDQRAREAVIDREISIGDYVLTGGELPAMVVCDAVARLVEGVLGNKDSSADESFENDLLEYPQYTRPADIEGAKVPDVLLSGDHKKIGTWRKQQSFKKTKEVRPDLLKEN